LNSQLDNAQEPRQSCYVN